MNIKQEIKEKILQSLSDSGFTLAENIEITHPDILDHGDYTTSFCLSEARKIGKNPREFADKILIELDKTKSDFIEKIEIAGPGFINFFLSKKFYAENIKEILEKKNN
jgi:arginyl-tRNA synthetase